MYSVKSRASVREQEGFAKQKRAKHGGCEPAGRVIGLVIPGGRGTVPTQERSFGRLGRARARRARSARGARFNPVKCNPLTFEQSGARRAPIHPLWGLLEIAGLTLAFFAVLWLLGPRIAQLPFALPGYWLLVACGGIYLLWISPVVLHRDPPEWRGWGGRGDGGNCPGSFRQAWQDYAGFTVFAGMVLLAYAWWRDPGKLVQIDWTAVRIKFTGYVVFGLVQDAVFFGFILVRFRKMIPMSADPDEAWRHQMAVALATATVFSCYHFPNPPLMGFTWLGGFCWSWLFYLRPNILLLALGHAVLGTILHRIVQLYTRIGPFYDQPDLYILRHVVPGLQRFAGNLF